MENGVIRGGERAKVTGGRAASYVTQLISAGAMQGVREWELQLLQLLALSSHVKSPSAAQKLRAGDAFTLMPTVWGTPLDSAKAAN